MDLNRSGVASVAVAPHQFFFAVGVGTLFFVPALPPVHIILAELGLVLD